jgi:hypothetical protein
MLIEFTFEEDEAFILPFEYGRNTSVWNTRKRTGYEFGVTGVHSKSGVAPKFRILYESVSQLKAFHLEFSENEL